MSSRRTLRAALAALLMALLGAAVVIATYRTSYASAWDDLHQRTQRRLEFLAADLASALDKYDTLPVVLSGHPQLLALLRRPADFHMRDDVNRLLQRLAVDAHVGAIYLMDRTGTTIAASNWSTPQSFVGQNYAFRPYFHDAVARGSGRFYAIGATTGEPGYFLARAVRADGDVAGVVAVKISLDDIEANWSRSGELLMLADANGVVFLASRPDWKFRTLEPLPAATLARIRAEQQYATQPLPPLPMKRPPGATADGVIRIASGEADSPGSRWLTVAGQRRAIGRMDWTLLSFSPVEDIAGLARGHAIAVALAYAFGLLGRALRATSPAPRRRAPRGTRRARTRRCRTRAAHRRTHGRRARSQSRTGHQDRRARPHAGHLARDPE